MVFLLYGTLKIFNNDEDLAREPLEGKLMGKLSQPSLPKHLENYSGHWT